MKTKFFSKNYFGKVFIVIWIVVITVVMSLQMASHLVSMPIPENIDNFLNKIKKSYYKDDGRAVIVHAIYEKCSCTNSLLKHLVERGLQPLSQEVIFVIGSEAPYESELVAKGFSVFKMKQDEFVNEFGIEAAPLLTLINNKGELKYMGGYFKTSEARVSTDQEIIQKALIEDKPPEPLPLYGCAVSDRLQKYIDPFQLNEL